MGFRVFDLRSDITHVLVTPQIRARFLRLEPGQVATADHSHDLGHEVFLVLAGRARFTIAGAEQELGPGQLCIALARQPHRVQVVGDEPLVMYLSVSPHVQPTHTGHDAAGQRLPLRFAPSSAYDVKADTDTPVGELLERCVGAAGLLAAAAAQSAAALEAAAAPLRQAVADGDEAQAGQMRSALWEGIRASFERVHELGEAWNALAPRLGPAA
ncbi:MAG: cupin domain-containing protein [Candidatus Latescibacterota bacterium]